jgi:uncharacterized protein YraI
MCKLRPVFIAALLTLFTTSAFALPAITRRPVGLHDGPHERFEVILVIPPNVDIEVFGCSGGWCEVDFGGEEGFVLQRSLDFYRLAPPVIIFPPAVYEFGWRRWRREYRHEWERRRAGRDIRRRPQKAPEQERGPAPPGSFRTPDSPGPRGSPPSRPGGPPPPFR